MEVDLLGRFAVRLDGREIAPGQFRGRLVRRLVRVLAAHHGRVVTRDTLVDALWGGQPPADPDANLNVLVNRARRALGERELIETVGGGYLLREAGVLVDAEQFEGYAGRARDFASRGDPAAALAAVDAALACWRGEPLTEDAYTEWARPVRDRLDRLYQDALELGAGAALATGAMRRASDLAAQAVDRQPLREAAHLLLVRALAAGGDQAGALAAYDKLRRSLADELGIDPSREAAVLRQRLLRGEPVDPSPGAAPAAGAVPLSGSPFVGREAELAALTLLGPEVGVAMIAGRSGAGKSRLLAEVCVTTDRRVVAARAVLPEREAPWSLARALLDRAVACGVDVTRAVTPTAAAALADLLPGVAATRVAYDPQTARALVLGGALRALQSTGRAMLVVDDLQWADSSSLEVLALLAERREDAVIVLAYRPEEVPDDSPVARFLAGLAGSRPLELALQPLRAEAITELIGSAEVAAVLAEETDGTPFAVLEALRDLDQAGAVRRRQTGGWDPVSPDALDRARLAARSGQQRAIWARVQRQPAERRELLGLLALLGRPGAGSLLAAATGSGLVEALSALHELGRSELVRHDSRGFAVGHDLVGETVRDRLDPVHRARLHQLLARALADAGSPDDELARHLARAGDLPASAKAYVRAGRDRLSRFADREAEQLAEEGLALDAGAQPRRELLEIRAETRARRGDLGAAKEDLRTALTLTGSGRERSRLLAHLAALVSGSDDLMRAASLAELAVVEAGDDPAARAEALYVAALLDMNLERRGRAEARFAEALTLFSQVGDARGVADILDARAMAQFVAGEIEGAVAAFAGVAEMFADSGNLLRVVTPRSTRGHGLLFAGKPAEALLDVEAALELARSLGYAEGESFALWHRAEALVGCGRLDEALAAAEASVAIARRVGHRGWTATGLRARGIALRAAADVAGAESAFRESLETSQHVPLFACWAHAQLALTLIPQGRLDEAASHVEQALTTGPPLGHYEARLARCELAVARGEPVGVLVAQAAKLAEAGGHRASLGRLGEMRRVTASQVPAGGARWLPDRD